MLAVVSRWCLSLAVAVAAVGSAGTFLTESAYPSARLGVAYFEPPRSIGTPIEDVARMYTGLGLADRIAGRLLLDTDASLNPAARSLIRRHLAQTD